MEILVFILVQFDKFRKGSDPRRAGGLTPFEIYYII